MPGRFCHLLRALLRRYPLILTLLISVSGISAGIAEALEPSAPFSLRNDNPFIAVYGLPPAETASLAGTGRWRARVVLDIANHAAKEEKGDEGLILDGETYRTSLVLQYGLSEAWEIGVELPYIRHSRGHLDGFIDNWHDLFGLSSVDRESFARNRLHYRYEHNGTATYDIRDSTGGVGDIRFTAARLLYSDSNPAPRVVSLRGAVKLPTGDAARLTGSEAVDLSADLVASDARTFRKQELVLYGRIGALFLGNGNVLPELQRDVVIYANVGMSRAFNNRLEARLQMDMHGPFYTGELERLASRSVQLTLGGSARLEQRRILDVGVVQNLVSDATPDVVLHFALRQAF